MRALITGGAGFVGQHLARALIGRGDAVASAGVHAEPARWLLSREERAAVHWLTADFRDAGQVDRAVAAAGPDVVFHLVGVSFPPDAERAPEAAYDVNVLGAVRLLRAVQAQSASGSDPLVIVVGSAVQYGRHDDAEMPLEERAEQRPATVYAASKAAQEVVALQAFRRDGARVICVRAFNHSGVGQPSQYVLPSLVGRVRGLGGSETALRMGNDVIRDYLHVDDVVTAYLSLADRGHAGEVYNVASGVGISTVQLARDVLLRAGATAEISFEPSLARSSDIPTLIGSSAKLRRDTGWAPKKTHIDIIDELLNAEAD